MLPPSDSPQLLPAAPPARAALSLAEVRKRVHARLTEKIDAVRTRHKPLSLVRQEARRIIDQFLDTECPTLTRSDRDKLVDDILAEGVGYGPFEELFRDEAVKEFQILGLGDVQVRKNDAWQPAAVKLRDADQLRQMLARFAEVGESLVGVPLAGGVDVRLANGFRVVAILPPEGSAPFVWFIRGAAQPVGSGSEVVAGPASGRIPARQTPRTGDSGLVSMTPPPGSEVLPTALTGRHSSSASGRMPQPPSAGPPSGRMPAVPAGPPSGRMPKPPGAEATQDTYARDRQRITERMIMKLASAGIFDLGAVPLPELRRFVLTAVIDYSDTEKLGWAPTLQERLALEILSAMSR